MSFAVDDDVLVLKPGKLKPLKLRFRGPYKIAATHGDAYTLKNNLGKNPFPGTVNAQRLKKYYNNDGNNVQEAIITKGTPVQYG